ncbi:Hypothetical_protein [Hexamita inflata]|uniref:Hypothetical_protein n=1 Tax=Hexamita inflata TaxID=28002 RepID=A0AA86URB7_9EUKA|nr:Hypothetical protein HINF_LOCUS45545 [Hexamita inflata]CAI9961737.1 Hypothetical protein HINF_LOCUS49382 [Hexamita inflata]
MFESKCKFQLENFIPRAKQDSTASSQTVHISSEPSDSIIVGRCHLFEARLQPSLDYILLLCNIPINCSFSSRVQLVEPYSQQNNESNGRYNIQFLLFRFERGLICASSYMSYCIFGPPSQNDVYLIIIKQQLYHQGWIKQDNIDHV